MSKKIKYALGTGLTVIILFSAFLIAAPHFIDANVIRSQIISNVKKSTGLDLSMNGPIAWSFFPAFSLQAEQVSLSNPQFSTKENLADIDQLKISLEILPLLLSQQVVLDELALNGAKINLITLANGSNNFTALMKSSAETNHNKTAAERGNKKSINENNFSIDELVLNNSQIIWDDQEKNHYWKFTNLSFNSRSLGFGHNFPFEMSTEVQNSNKNPIILNINADANLDPEHNLYILKSLKIHGTANEQKINLSLDEFQLNSSNKLVVLNKLIFDGFGTHATGSLNAKNNGKYPEVQGNFKLNQILLDKLRITDINLPVNGQQGIYQFKPISSTLYGGTVNSNITLNMTNNAPKWNANYQLINLPALTFFEEVYGSDSISGLCQSTGQLSASGFTTNDLIHSLTGNIALELSNGSLNGVDLSYWWQVGNKLLNADITLTGLSDRKRTEINKLTGSFTVKNGLAETNDLNIYNSILFVRGQGQIDLVNHYLNMTLYVSNSSNGKPSGTAIPLIVSGNFGKITVRPDEKTIAAMAAKVLSSKVGEVATAAIEKNLPAPLKQPLNSVVNKLLGQ